MSRLKFAVTVFRLAAVVLVAAGTALSSADDRVDAFLVGRLWNGTDPPVADAVLVVRNGTVVASGARSDVEIPATAEVHDLSHAVVIPGLVIAETSVGMADDDERTVTPEVLAVDGFDQFGDYSRYLAAGVTTVQISPGRQRLLPGVGAVVKLSGSDPERRVLSRTESLRIILSDQSASVPRIYEPPVGAVSVDNPLKPTRPQVGEGLATRLAGLRAIFRAAVSGASDPDNIMDLAAVREALQSGKVRITAHDAAEIRAALTLFQDLHQAAEGGPGLVLSGPKDLRALEAGLDAGVEPRGIILTMDLRPGEIGSPAVPAPDAEPQPEVWEIAARLADRGLERQLALRPAVDSDLEDILFLSGLLTRGGNPAARVLQMVTANAAQILGVEDRVGSLAPGRDADFVVLSGDPFHHRTSVRETWIDGRRVWLRDAVETALLIRAKAVMPTGDRRISDGSVLVSGSKVLAVGSEISVPEAAEVREFPGAVIVPGFIDLATGLGFGGQLSGVSLSTRLGEQLASDDPDIAFARQGGVTTVVYSAAASPGPLLAFKLSDQPRLLREPVGMRFTVSGNLTTTVPSLKRTLAAGKAYADSWVNYETALSDYQKKLKEYEAALAKYEAEKKAAEAAKASEQKPDDKDPEKKTEEEPSPKPSDSPAPDQKPEVTGQQPANPPSGAQTEGGAPPKSSQDDPSKPAAAESAAAADPAAPKKPEEPKKPAENAGLEPYRALFAKTIPAVAETDSVNAIRAAVELFRDDLDLELIIAGSDDVTRVTELLAGKHVGVVAGPGLVRRVDGVLDNIPQTLSNHQIPMGFRSGATTGVRNLPLAVQYAVFRGLGTNDALNGLTQSAAELLHLQDQIGTLKAGGDADLVVLSGPPFHPSSEVLAVMIDGIWVYEQGAEQ